MTGRKKDKQLTLVNVVHNLTLYRNTRMPALSLAQLAAYVPDGWNARIIDETVEKFNPAEHIEDSDIIGISGGNVCNIERVVDIIEEVEEFDALLGTETPVIIGGYVASTDPEFFANRTDSVVIGPGELALQQLLKDFEKGKMQRIYHGKRIPINELKKPDFSGFNIPAYGKNINWPVQTSVSCNNRCTFCSTRVVYGHGYEAAEPGKTLDIISDIPERQRIYFTDPNIVTFSAEGQERAKKLFKGMAKMNHHPWYGALSFKISRHDSILEAMKESNCYGVLIGFDSVSPASLQAISGGRKYKAENETKLLNYFIKGVKKIQEKYGIDVLGTFVIGFDQDNGGTFDNTIRLIQDSGIKDAQCMPLTPLPPTPLYRQMEEAGRIFDHNFAHYDFTEVVFQPNNFTPRELRRHMARIYRRLGLVRDRPEEIRIKSVGEEVEKRIREEKEAEQRAREDARLREEARRRADQGGH